MTDQRIIELLRTNKVHRAFSRLYNYQRTVKKFVLANSGSKQDADDIFQEGLIILYRKVSNPDFSLTSSLDSLLFGICRNLWLGQLRNDRIHGKSLPHESEITEDIDIDREHQFRLAERALESISDVCKEILRLFYNLNLSMTEIASRLGYSSDNVAKTQKYKCLERARENYLQLKSDNK